MKLIDTYFKHVEFYEDKYGEKTIVLMQVGAFFEVYGKKHKTIDGIFGSKITEFCNICDLNMSEKAKVTVNKKADNNKTIKCNILMAGFRDFVCDKYIQKLNSAGYTCVIFTQNEENPSAERELSQIITPGTFFSEDVNVSSNNIMVLSLYHKKPSIIMGNKSNKFHYGIANIDILSGETMIFEHDELFYNSLTTFDELEKNYSVYNPNEVLVVYESENIETSYVNKILKYVGCNSKVVRIIDKNDINSSLSKQAKVFESDKYKLETLKTYYKDLEYESIQYDLLEHTLAYESLCFLLDYIHGHNENMCSKLREPKINVSNEKMVLANHSLKQLNIIDDNNDYNGKLSSVLSFLNCCITPMGKRKLKFDLVNPTSNVEILEKEYNLIDSILNNFNFWKDVMTPFTSYKDFEKLFRKIVIRKSSPTDMRNLINNLTCVKDTLRIVSKENNFNLLSPYSFSFDEIKKSFDGLYGTLTTIYDIKSLNNGNADAFDSNFFNKTYNPELADLECEYMESYDKLLALMDFYSDIIKGYENKSKTDCYIKINETEKSGIFLKLSEIRSKKLIGHYKDKYKLSTTHVDTVTFKSSYSKKKKTFEVVSKDLSIEKRGKDNYISSKLLSQLCYNVVDLKNKLKQQLKDEFNKTLVTISEYSDNFIKITDFVVSLDVRFNKAKLAMENNYCKPVIVDNYNGESYFECKQMRHPLIEKLNTNEIYIPNDVEMTPESKGILLFGTNAVGKSSLIKSIGINIIMAQSGMYVACEELKFIPFTSLFTRILGNDNIFKGLSTFAVEMSELRTILKQSDSRSLVLGDELCSGTELGSAISIFVAGLVKLYQRDAKYIFATHFHEVTSMRQVTDLEHLHMKHMSVHYDAEIDALVYDRLLRDGPGNNMYGLEVCKSLNLPLDFLDLANDIRKEKFSSKTLISDTQGSTYNKRKLKTDCEMCGSPCEDVHHLQHQKNANDKNFIKHFHKNTQANLMNVCKECHNEFHKISKQHRRVKTTKGYKLYEV
jgi:DNA mismatch repair protein MutS